ncbi:hypothetical protein KAI87_06835, partial [Myxococcota bacterium]|nr:hypothetical protein [Myxococcota bacterium]
MHYRVLLPALLAVFISVLGQNASAEPRSKVIINGTAAPVFFNDGDSFRVLDGRLEGTKCRLGGYNTLESHGAVHRWGTWTVKEMYNNAKMATTFARKRSWQCTTDMQRDIYLRVLMHCPELATEQI